MHIFMYVTKHLKLRNFVTAFCLKFPYLSLSSLSVSRFSLYLTEAAHDLLKCYYLSFLTAFIAAYLITVLNDLIFL